MTTTETPRRARVWLAAGLGARPAPIDRPTVRDHLMRHWRPGPDGRWHTPDGRHHADWTELHTRYDLVEVTR
ncbi:hypothetical protein [Amycolatopsis sp. NPDC051903]|uniref:hypothetical protein n=1 Tax=Amycolatopsis sp. NPDC051903 TaxID=3363936 RepID=UPI00378A28D8